MFVRLSVVWLHVTVLHEAGFLGLALVEEKTWLLPAAYFVAACDQTMRQRLAIGFLGRPDRVRIVDRSEHDTAVRVS